MQCYRGEWIRDDQMYLTGAGVYLTGAGVGGQVLSGTQNGRLQASGCSVPDGRGVRLVKRPCRGNGHSAADVCRKVDVNLCSRRSGGKVFRITL